MFILLQGIVLILALNSQIQIIKEVFDNMNEKWTELKMSAKLTCTYFTQQRNCLRSFASIFYVGISKTLYSWVWITSSQCTVYLVDVFPKFRHSTTENHAWIHGFMHDDSGWKYSQFDFSHNALTPSYTMKGIRRWAFTTELLSRFSIQVISNSCEIPLYILWICFITIG